MRPRIFTAAEIVTMSAPAEAFATLGPRVVAVGGLDELRRRFPDAGLTDLGAATIAPGFNDAHQHPTLMAELLLEVDLSPDVAPDRDTVLRRLRERAAETPSGEWVQGARYDHAKSTSGVPLNRDDLDAVLPDHPVFVRQIGMHWGVLNTAGLRALGIAEDAPDPVGGALSRDEHGRLTGVVHERAVFEIVDRGLPLRPMDERLAGLERYQGMMHAAGITSVGDALVWPQGVDLLQEARARDRLRLRVNMLLAYPAVDALADLGLRTGLGDEWLRVGGVKAFVDGAVAGGTCLLEEPFEHSGSHGLQAIPTDELQDFVRRVHGGGGTLAVHANGDRAIRLLLDAVEAAQRAEPRPDARHRIEHCSLVDDEILARIAAAGMVAVPFGSYVWFHGEKLPGYYGERVERMFAHRDLLDAGVPTAGSSDFPCGPYEVLQALRSCVTRRAADGTVLGARQRITIDEALALYTTGAAYASGEEEAKGSLAPGMLADFIVLDRDPRSIPGEELAELEVLETWIGAERVYARADSERRGG